ncbi:MAG: hypothetical protein IRY99_00995 [Isosphaeraceae bacterium]|nr:hypothetical protein [Isosphaeraceae bacterium]
MTTTRETRRGFLGRVAAVLGGLAAVPALARPAQAGRTTWRRWGWGPYYRRWTRTTFRFRRFYGGPYGGYYGPRFYGPGFYGYGPGFYGPGYVPFGGFQLRIYRGPGFYGPGYYGGYPPILKRDKPFPDPLSLLEA